MTPVTITSWQLLKDAFGRLSRDWRAFVTVMALPVALEVLAAIARVQFSNGAGNPYLALKGFVLLLPWMLADVAWLRHAAGLLDRVHFISTNLRPAL